MFRARLGVRTRILAIALIPSLTLLVVGVGAAGYLVAEGNHAKDWAVEMRQAVPQARELIEAVQHERHLTLAHITGDQAAAGTLPAVRNRVDAALRGILEVSGGIRAIDESGTADNSAGFNTLTQHLTSLRATMDVGQLPANDGYTFYSTLLDDVTVGSQVAQKSAPDAEIGIEITEGIRLLYAAEAMSRSHTLGMVIVNTDWSSPIPMEEYLHQVGFYHTEMSFLSAELAEGQRERAEALTSSPAWQQLSAMENAIAQRSTTAASTSSSTSTSTGTGTRQAEQPPLPLSTPEWESAAAEVNRQLLNLYTSQYEHTQLLAEEKADRSAKNSLYAGGGVIAVSVIAFLTALWLANRIIRRLKRLRGETLVLADERLPDMMRRLAAGEPVDPAAESPNLDYGHDEIGQVAKAFQHAHSAAVAGAVNEARTREGVKAVFLNIAHRSQIVVHRQLEILDAAEDRQEDPALLDTLFKLDHLATRERRNAENLIILGGGQPGRQWRNPVPLIDLVRSAVGETLDYARVRVARLPETHVMGTVVADLIHLLAELIDNATSFSPPQSRVEVTGNVVGKGVVAEISDQGMGMSESEMARLNKLLSSPPDFGVAALSADSRLGLFVVAQLAVRHGVTVRLAESDYGGIRAIVLIPAALLATDSPPRLGISEGSDSLRRRRHPVPFVESAPPRGYADSTESAVLTAEPIAPPATDPAQFYPAQTDFDRTGALQENPAQPHPAQPHPAQPNGVVPNGVVPPQSAGPDGRPALPRRQRQASIAPELTQSIRTEPDAPQPPERERSAEQARDLMSAIEIGTRQGRRAEPNEHTGTFEVPVLPPSDEQEGHGDFFQPR